MNSKWQIHRVGLIDFWYYDEEEFLFQQGRMLLRGANGSGKSVTMQSFIPLLLDGNMRPERLDPFGSRARKMENYLLEEGDEREERTGYLYMELRREENEEYLSLGIGIRARKNKKLESWYFCITDGRRIGKDLFLYKDEKNKITCSKTELKNRIGDGGKLMETQGEYAQCVNKVLFGFETQEEYKELLELLIQLRTPKLSKDFKPTVINEILSSSLQTLSEDELRPMSEAIENMDNLKTNLDTLTESIGAAKQIEKIYDQYNQIALYQKAFSYLQTVKSHENGKTEQMELEEKRLELHRQVESERLRYQELESEETILRNEKNSLDQSDAAKLKEQEMKLQEDLKKQQEEKKKKTTQEQEKREKQIELENKRKDVITKNESTWEEIEESLEEMEEELGEIPFDEFAFLKKDLCNEKEKEYSFSSHHQLLNAYTQKVLNARDQMVEETNCQEKYDRYLKELDEFQEKKNRAEKEVQQYENQLHETKEEYVEHLYSWDKENQEIHLDTAAMQAISKKVQQYKMGDDFSEVRDMAKKFFYEKEQLFAKEKIRLEQSEKEAKESLQIAKSQLEEWENQKDPEPEMPECVRKNREVLREHQIPYLPFYKTIDFGERMEEVQKDRLEEALLEMGVLNALIIPQEYRSKVYELDTGICDHYIFSDITHVRDNLMEILEIDNGENDILLYQNISHVLSSIGFGSTSTERGVSWIDPEGNYKLGILEGTITKEYKARFIGVRARENYRREKIDEFQKLCLKLQEEVDSWKKQLEHVMLQESILKKEWEAFPKEEDLKTAAKDLAEKEQQLEFVQNQLKVQQGMVEQERKRLDEIRLIAREACAKCYLPARLDVLVEAVDSLQVYRELLSKVQVLHGDYRNGLQACKDLEERLEDLEVDIDEIRYEIGKMLQKEKELEHTLTSIRGQLALTDYEAIKGRLDTCIRRLREIPREREDSVRKRTEYIKTEESYAKRGEELRERLQHLQVKKERLQHVFKAEYQLRYVVEASDLAETEKGQAEQIVKQLGSLVGQKKQSDVLGNLQEVFHRNRGYLLDYHITLQTLFEDLEEENIYEEIMVKRIDVGAKYRGNSVTFKELIEKMTEDAEALTTLLSDKDRELFEDILANTISKKIRGKIQSSRRWVEKMNTLMESMQTSSGLRLSLRWKHKRAEHEEQMDTKALVELLQKDVEIMREEEVESLSAHFRSKIAQARKIAGDTGAVQSFHGIIREVLDYRKWFEFQLEFQKTGEKKKELTDRAFFTFSGGEKAMAMYVPLFSAVVAKYAGARQDAPRLISLDEAFAGVDEMNIRDMFRLMVEFEFNFMINSQILWGDYDTVPALAIYQLIRPENAKYVSVISYIWNGKQKVMV